MELSNLAKNIIKHGSVKLRILRSGMYQQITFDVKEVKSGNVQYKELFTTRMIDVSELTRVANEVGLPVAAQNAVAFPEGTTVQDFINSLSSMPT